MTEYDRYKIDADAEREGKALSRAAKPKRNSSHHNRMRQRDAYNQTRFDELFRR